MQKTLLRVCPEKSGAAADYLGRAEYVSTQTKDKSYGEQNNDLTEEVLSRQNMLKVFRENYMHDQFILS